MSDHRRYRLPDRVWPLAIALALVALAASLAQSIVMGSPLVRADVGASALSHAHAGAGLLHVAGAVTLLGGTAVALPLAAIGAITLLTLAERRGALTLLAAVVLVQPVVDLIKHAMERPRPAANVTGAEAAGWSFPSGHSATSAALLAALALIASERLTGRARALAIAGAACLLVAVGTTRVMLGAHYPTDVLAGWCVGGALTLCCWWATRRLAAHRVSAATTG